MSIKKQFAKYVSLNILAMVGLSCYILADSYFIAKSQGADGLTALNLALPLYNLIFAIGSMIGTGSAIRYTIAKLRNFKDADNYIFNSVFFTLTIGIIFAAAGNIFPEQILTLLGADKDILNTGMSYTRIFMSFSPFFMLNYVANAYVRNDGAPNIAMAATLISSLFNIVFDYILMFPFKMGMNGAALATGLSPVIGIGICLIHLLSSKSGVKIKLCLPSFKRLYTSCQVGISAFISEISSGIITMTFNFLILRIAGNTGVAAYGIVANIALVAVAFSNGIAQGSQPLISKSFAHNNMGEVSSLRRMSLIIAFAGAAFIYIILALFAVDITGFFNHEGNELLAEYSVTGIRLYFIGILFAGLNIVGSSFFSAVENVRKAFIVSILRGFVLIIFFAFLLSLLFGMNGVWLAYTAAELCTSAVVFYFMYSRKKVDHSSGWDT
ncbi:MAG: MATE family efflux transporter [Ruminococcus sp.]